VFHYIMIVLIEKCKNIVYAKYNEFKFIWTNKPRKSFWCSSNYKIKKIIIPIKVKIDKDDILAQLFPLMYMLSVYLEGHFFLKKQHSLAVFVK